MSFLDRFCFVKIKNPTIILHQGDLPSDVRFEGSVAVDSETLGLNLARDKLCLVQLSAGDGTCHLVQLDRRTYDAPNLKALFTDASVVKIFHYARFDVAAVYRYLNVSCASVYCTKIASKLVRTYTDRHGLKDLCRELVSVDLSKEQQSSDWGAAELSEEQKHYAASDVLYLHAIREKLDMMLAREQRTEIAQSCFDFVGTRVVLDLEGWGETDIFAH
ncbi:MAG: ribonuclease D [Rhodospirillales bacterium]|jgi:ribonuclease D